MDWFADGTARFFEGCYANLAGGAGAVSAMGRRLAKAQQTPAAKPEACSGCSAAAVKVAPKPKVTLNVRDYGATGDGTTKDTLALQLTIERCSVLGGGEVVLPAGNYLTGALDVAQRGYAAGGRGCDD